MTSNMSESSIQVPSVENQPPQVPSVETQPAQVPVETQPPQVPSVESQTIANGVPQPNGEKKPMRLVDVPITDQQSALQLLVTFVNLAQSRGVFKIDESAKIYECIKRFE